MQQCGLGHPELYIQRFVILNVITILLYINSDLVNKTILKAGNQAMQLFHGQKTNTLFVSGLKWPEDIKEHRLLVSVSIRQPVFI